MNGELSIITEILFQVLLVRLGVMLLMVTNGLARSARRPTCGGLVMIVVTSAAAIRTTPPTVVPCTHYKNIKMQLKYKDNQE